MTEDAAVTVEIESVVHGGHGLARIEGQVWFVPGGLPGDVAVLRLLDRRKGVGWAQIEKIVTPSPHRCEAGCRVFGRCGGCNWLDFAYPAQGEWKARMVGETLQRLGGVTVALDRIEDPALRLGYRTRARFHCRGGGKTGYYAPRSHDVVPIEACPLCHPRLNAVLARLCEADFQGDVEVVVNPESDDVLAWTSRPAPRLADVLPPPGQEVAGRPCFQFDGRPVLAGTFSQSSLLLNRLLVREVEQMLNGAKSVLDLYCGNGNLSLGLGPDVEVAGMDQDRAAVGAAASMGRGTYRACQEPHFLPLIGRGGWDAIVLDPPRLGAKLLTAALAGCQAAKIVYVSCNAATLARDLRELAQGNWSVTRGVVVDLFPQTPHVETVIQLERL